MDEWIMVKAEWSRVFSLKLDSLTNESTLQLMMQAVDMGGTWSGQQARELTLQAQIVRTLRPCWPFKSTTRCINDKILCSSTKTTMLGLDKKHGKQQLAKEIGWYCLLAAEVLGRYWSAIDIDRLSISWALIAWTGMGSRTCGAFTCPGIMHK